MAREHLRAHWDRLRSLGRMVSLRLTTRVPEKWRAVDLETGDVWRWDIDSGGWRRADDLTYRHSPTEPVAHG